MKSGRWRVERMRIHEGGIHTSHMSHPSYLSCLSRPRFTQPDQPSAEGTIENSLGVYSQVRGPQPKSSAGGTAENPHSLTPSIPSPHAPKL